MNEKEKNKEASIEERCMTGFTVYNTYEPLQRLKLLYTLLRIHLHISTSGTTEYPCREKYPAASCARYIRCPFGL